MMISQIARTALFTSLLLDGCAVAGAQPARRTGFVRTAEGSAG